MAIKTVSDRAITLRTELERILPIIISEYKPEKVIVFGSLASGSIDQWSDIDLVIVKETDKWFFERIDEVVSIIKPKEGVDLLVYTPAEFAELCMKRRFFRVEVLAKGRILYG
jgi:predicted nucleotidyltransferase